MADDEKSKEMMKQMEANLPKLCQLSDRHGNSFYFGNAGDYWHPPFPIGKDADFRDHVKNIRNMEIRKDDILICSFPKTGLHWNSEIITMLLKQKAELGTDSEVFMSNFIDFLPTQVINQKPSPRILLTHVPLRHVPKQAFEKKIRIIHLERNPKDVLVSFYNHLHSHNHPLNFPGTFEHFVDLYLEVGYLYGDLFQYMRDWEECIESLPEGTVYTSVFEDLKNDTLNCVLKMNEYLGTKCSTKLCEEIASRCSFNNMKAFKDTNVTDLEKALFKEGAAGFYRKGQIGDWKNWFSASLNQRFDDQYAKRMVGYKRQFKYTK